ncbi:MAG: PAS domain-containing protein [Emcibacter sp.]|nr:PAS domain-containing protein [Emcibacter sp.]
MNLRPKSAGVALAVMVIAGAVVSLFLALKFAQSESDRDSLVWQRQMSVVINSREVAVEEWLAAQKKVIARLADNPSLRIYLGNLQEGDVTQEMTGQSQEKLAQAAYLENQMKAVAKQNGYISQVNRKLRIKANLDIPRISGLALTNPQGQIIVSTAAMPSVIRPVAGFLARGADSDVIIYGPYEVEQGLPAIAFIAPVFGVQDDNSSPAIGFAIGIKILPKEFYQKLIQPGETAKTAKSYLVRTNGTAMEYLSPLRSRNGDDYEPLTIVLDAENAALAAVFALRNAAETVGGFAERVNYDGERVLVTGRKIKNTDWVLVRTVNSSEVMGAIMARKRTIIWIAGLIILAVSISILLIWRHGVSVRLTRAADRQRILISRYEKLSQFLQIVTDSQHTVITAVDDQGCYTFANAQAIRDTGISHQEMIGRKATSLPGALKSPEMEDHYLQVLKTAQHISVVEKLPDNGITIKSDYVPLSVDRESGVLMVTEDISELVRERELKETALNNLVNTLTMVIDSRDPYSARHSERVAIVTDAIAREMNVDDVARETANIAGALMNLGKILVPRELLTRPKGLSEDEIETIRTSLMKTADMLETVEFDGPVVKTLRQIRAHWDGSGIPDGLMGQDILVSARIVAVANAFVGMTSARAHRAGMDMKEAAFLLLNDVERIYDRKPVTALMNYLENNDGMEKWNDFGVPLVGIPEETE